jgi:hypothetical protein
MSEVTFTAVLELHGKTATGIEVPADVVERLGGGRRPAVVVTFGGHSYRTTLGSMGGRVLIPVSAEHRTAAGVSAGDTLQISLAPDAAPREVELPADLAAALDAAPGLRAAFDRLSPSRRKEHVRAIVEAKKPETRDRRVTSVVDGLRDGAAS